MQHRFLSSIHDIKPENWNLLCGTDYPFLTHEFFAALEDSQSTIKATGWQPYHLIIEEGELPIAIMPLFLKYHSYGEYVFDWSWADAYHRYGQEYYPKLVTAIPFTPATGPRWSIDPTVDKHKVELFLFSVIEKEAKRIGVSSYHCLFPDKEQQTLLNDHYLQRVGCQYHWLNKYYSSFDEFLSTFNSRKRKNLKKERQKVLEQDIQLSVKEGNDISDNEWQQFYLFYHLTYLKRSGQKGYLTSAFFPLLAKKLSQHLMMVQARKNNDMVAAALYFKDSKTLYGRYWGCQEEFDNLHFEACYYQGIEYAIHHRLERFDPGAQGEHKIQRGFTPVATYSYHWINDHQFREGVKHFLQSETPQIYQYIEDISKKLPFKQAENQE